jgi:hypothetical protein
MTFTATTVLIALALFAGMLVLLEVGRRVGQRRLQRDGEGGRAGVAAVEGSVFGLMGLLIAFTFSGASARFEARRALIVEETNAIGTAWLRIDLLSESAQPDLRRRFRDYVDSRIETYRNAVDIEGVQADLARSAGQQRGIWAAAVEASREPPLPQATMLLLPALNQMIDITTSRTMAMQFHQPTIIFAVLMALALLASLLAGFGMAGSRAQRWVHMVGFAAITATAIYVILDLEYPRRGLIRVDAADQVLVELRASMD